MSNISEAILDLSSKTQLWGPKCGIAQLRHLPLSSN